jgi:hypothetical protein
MILFTRYKLTSFYLNLDQALNLIEQTQDQRLSPTKLHAVEAKAHPLTILTPSCRITVRRSDSKRH